MSDIIPFQTKDSKARDEHRDAAKHNIQIVEAYEWAGFTREEAVLILLKLMETED